MKISSSAKAKIFIIISVILLIGCIFYIILMTPPAEEKPVLTVYTYIYNEISKHKLTELTLHDKVLCLWVENDFDGKSTCGIPFAFICPDTKIILRTDGKRVFIYGKSRNYHNTADLFLHNTVTKNLFKMRQ
jgi:hypothetical protein